jgi:hypothetical protein
VGGRGGGVFVAISVRAASFEAKGRELKAVDQVLLEGQPQGVAVADAGGAVEDEGIHSFIHSFMLFIEEG